MDSTKGNEGAQTVVAVMDDRHLLLVNDIS